MNIKKLKNYDLHQAKVGDLVLCRSLNKGEVVYIDHNQVVIRWEDTLNIFDIEEEHSIHLRPLAWLGEDPVYKGDTLYSVHSEHVVNSVDCGRLYSTNGSYFPIDGDKLQSHELFSLTPVTLTIVVNGFEVPAPITCPPEKGANYYVASVLSEKWHNAWSWFGNSTDILVLKRGIAHTTEESAVAHAMAMAGFDPKWRRGKS